MLKALLPGDILVDWGGDSLDVLREHNLLHFRAWLGADVDHQLVDDVRELCVPNGEWRLKRWCKDRHAIFCDPFGRVVVWTGAHRCDVPFADIEKEGWPKYRRPHGTPHWKKMAVIVAARALHTRCWELTPPGEEIEPDAFKIACRAAHQAMKLRMDLGKDASLNVHQFRLRYGPRQPRDPVPSRAWWDRLAEYVGDTGDARFPSIQQMAFDPDMKWISANTKEIEAMLSLVGWPEWDVDNPPVYIAPRNKRSSTRRQRNVGRSASS